VQVRPSGLERIHQFRHHHVLTDIGHTDAKQSIRFLRIERARILAKGVGSMPVLVRMNSGSL
jgi:hypothetical protein